MTLSPGGNTFFLSRNPSMPLPVMQISQTWLRSIPEIQSAAYMGLEERRKKTAPQCRVTSRGYLIYEFGLVQSVSRSSG